MSTVTQPIEIRHQLGVVGGFVTLPKTRVIKEFLDIHCQEHDVPIFFHFLTMSYKRVAVMDRFRPQTESTVHHRTLVSEYLGQVREQRADLVIALVDESAAEAENYHQALEANGFARWWNTREGYLMKLELAAE